jgi:hypothetical protein
MFKFFVDHMALVYLINKPQIFSMLVRWFLLFQEDDFKIVYKLGRSHLMVDALSRLPNHIKLVGVPNQTCDVHMFTLQLEWLHNVYEHILNRTMPQRITTSQKQYLAQRTKPFVLQEGVLYKFRQYNKFHWIL